MRKQNGFTLLEVLIVVVIAVSVAAFAVPAYKKTQEKNKYLAAQGALLDLGTAVRALRADIMADGGNSNAFPFGHALLLTNTYQNNAGSSLTTHLQNQGTDTLARSLFSRQYMQPVAFDTGTTDKYKGFSLVVCGAEMSSSGYCCPSDPGVIVCMYNDDLGASSSTAGQYWGAYFMEDGTIQRVSK